MEEKVYDLEEYERHLRGPEQNCKEGFDKNPEYARKTKEQKEKDWEFVVKTACIIKDLLNGNEKLAEKFPEEALGHNAIAGGFQGRDSGRTIIRIQILQRRCSSFGFEGAREPYIFATENDTLNAVSMLFGKLLTNRAQMFSDVRTCWSSASVKRVTGYELTGEAARAGGIIHLINSGASCLDMCGEVTDENNQRVTNHSTI